MAVIKGLILAAGLGKRLRPLTNSISKPMLPFAGQPLIAYPLQKLLFAGVTNIGIVVGENEAELANGLSHIPVELTFIRQDEPRGLAHAVNCAQHFCGDSDFCLLFCDNLFQEPLNHSMARWDALRITEPNMQALVHTVEMADPRAYGVAEVADGWAVGLEEKPAQPKSNLAVVGIDYLTPAIFEAIAQIKPSARGELEITDALAMLITLGHKVAARPLGGFWYDTGTVADLLAAHPPVLGEFGAFQVKGSYKGSKLQGPVGIVRGSEVLDSEVNGPVLVAYDCLVTNCKLGPNVSIEAGCTLANCDLRDCLVYPGSELSNVIASNAILADGKQFPG